MIILDDKLDLDEDFKRINKLIKKSSSNDMLGNKATDIHEEAWAEILAVCVTLSGKYEDIRLVILHYRAKLLLCSFNNAITFLTEEFQINLLLQNKIYLDTSENKVKFKNGVSYLFSADHVKELYSAKLFDDDQFSCSKYITGASRPSQNAALTNKNTASEYNLFELKFSNHVFVKLVENYKKTIDFIERVIISELEMPLYATSSKIVEFADALLAILNKIQTDKKNSQNTMDVGSTFQSKLTKKFEMSTSKQKINMDENIPTSSNQNFHGIDLTFYNRTKIFSLINEISAWFKVNEPNSPVPFFLNKCHKLKDYDFLSILENLFPEEEKKFRRMIGGRDNDDAH